MSEEELTRLLAPEKYTGRAEAQTERFIATVIDPILANEPKLDIGEIRL